MSLILNNDMQENDEKDDSLPCPKAETLMSLTHDGDVHAHEIEKNDNQNNNQNEKDECKKEVANETKNTNNNWGHIFSNDSEHENNINETRIVTCGTPAVGKTFSKDDNSTTTTNINININSETELFQEPVEDNKQTEATIDDVVDDVDDNDSHISYESDSSMESKENNLFTIEARRFRQERHANFLQYLNSKYEGKIPEKPTDTVKIIKNQKRDKAAKVLYSVPQPVRGMMLFNDDEGDSGFSNINCNDNEYAIMSTETSKGKTETMLQAMERIKTLNSYYPGREPQIRLLASLVSATVSQSTHEISEQSAGSHTYVPGPIFVSGPPGTGKTAIVMDIVEIFSGATNDLASRVSSAYVNCALLVPSTVDRLVADAYNQFVQGSQTPQNISKNNNVSNTKKRKFQSLKFGEHSHNQESTQRLDVSETTSNINNNSNLSPQDLNSDKVHLDMNFAQSNVIGEERVITKSDIVHEETAPTKQRRIQPQRSVKKDDKPKSNNLKPPLPNSKILTQKVDSSWSSQSAVAALGRALQPLFGGKSFGCGILILDHADRLLNLSQKQSSDSKSNHLAELLLLPQVATLNLTVIAISNNILLESSRLNNNAKVGKSVSSLSGGLHPTRIQFPAYKGVETFTKLLLVPGILRLIVGESSAQKLSDEAQEFRRKAIVSFVGVVAQSASGETRDLRDFIRIGRTLWPIYLSSLQSIINQDNATIMSSHESILLQLNKSTLPRLGHLLKAGLIPLHLKASTATEVTEASPLNQLFYRKCLLLAAFLCQNNKADNDKKVFSIQGNGKKKKNNNMWVEPAEENGATKNNDAGDDDDSQHSRMMRPRPFTLERMLSIFVTICTLNPIDSNFWINFDGSNDIQQSLGSICLYEHMAHWQHVGYLHEVKQSGPVGEQNNLKSPKYWCSLGRTEAEVIAKTIGIPLSNYLF